MVKTSLYYTGVNRGTPSSRVPAWIQKYGAALWFTYLGVALGLAASIITLEGADFWGGVHYLWLPYAVIIFGFVCYYHDALIALPVERGKKRGNPWSAAVLLYLFALVSGYPYVMLVNTLGGPHPQIVYHGAITKKWSSTPKRYSVMIQDEGSQSNYTFAVSGTYYRKCQVGQVFECRMYVGLLGIPYRWTGSP